MKHLRLSYKPETWYVYWLQGGQDRSPGRISPLQLHLQVNWPLYTSAPASSRVSFAADSQSSIPDGVPVLVEPDGEGVFTSKAAERLRSLIQEEVRSALASTPAATPCHSAPASSTNPKGAAAPPNLITTSAPNLFTPMLTASATGSSTATLLSGGQPPVPAKWASKMLAGEYIDFALLLSDVAPASPPESSPSRSSQALQLRLDDEEAGLLSVSTSSSRKRRQWQALCPG